MKISLRSEETSTVLQSPITGLLGGFELQTFTSKFLVVCLMARGSSKKTCPNCGEKIFCALRYCDHCRFRQPQKQRLQKKLNKFHSQQKEWLDSIKKNNLKSHIVDYAAILLEKLHVLGLKPMLLIGHPKNKRDKTCKTTVMLPVHAHLGPAAKKCADDIDGIYKKMVEGWTSQGSDQVDDTLPPPQEEDQTPTQRNDSPPKEEDHTLPQPNNLLKPKEEEIFIKLEREDSPPPPNRASAILETPQNGPNMQQQQGRHKRLKKIKECPHNQLETFPVQGILQTRKREGKTEHLYDWQPCSTCGTTWPPSWEPA
ncbi:uncharacterized protein LOC133449246 isoform X2 [Cololabis saira]|uniref:uncharacterized protein LOC133449246 isoform X2 n=1 Tax=Cololabis saira TaxID=129043 RepID=UPI002AD43542|nr:uncharacterized protein LOC133449246 isoform X2 [Cololabis saira]